MRAMWLEPGGPRRARPPAANGLSAGGATEVVASEDQVKTFMAMVKSGAIPADLRSALAALAVGSKDLKRVRAGLLHQSVTLGAGPALVEPLNDAGDVKAAISQLSKFAKRARRHPIAR